VLQHLIRTIQYWMKMRLNAFTFEPSFPYLFEGDL
jgi:hypothetical protein